MLSVAGNLETSLTMENTHVSKAWGHTKSDLFGTKYIWAIDHFSFHGEVAGIAVKSPAFNLALPDRDIELQLIIYPNGENSFHIAYVSGYVQVLTKDVSLNAKAKIGLINRHGQEKELFSAPKSVTLTQFAKMGSPSLCLRSNLSNASHEHSISSDLLTVFCEFSVVRDSTNVRCANFTRTMAIRTVSDDIKDLFETQKHSDFTLIVNGRTIKVHKIILAARSPMFAAIMPKTQTEMEVTDLSYYAVLEFVRYIYTGLVEDIDSIAQELLLASIKYKMDGLQPICYENIISNMDIANAADLLGFAHDNKLADLKEAALSYFKKHSKAITKTDGFQILKQRNPQLVLNDLFEAISI